MQSRIPTLVLALAFSPLASPQSPNPSLSAESSLLNGDGWRVPIHTMPDDPTFGSYGVWAAGQGYKVSFHGGMEFHAVLGSAAPRSLPLRWHTDAVRLGERDLLGTRSPEPVQGEWRYEYRSQTVSEIYDVESAGVEQSFVIASPPAELDRRGDLVVTGRFEGPLDAMLEPTESSGQAAIRFCDENGQEIARYGEAIAFDAVGRRVEVATSLVGNEVALTVPAAWVEHATFPITIDPLLAPRTTFATSAIGASIESSDVEVRSGNAARRVMTVFSLPVSANDTDLYAVLTDEDFGSRAFVFTDLSAAIHTDDPSVAFVDQAGPNGRWTIAWTRSSPGISRVRVHLRDGDETIPANGTTLFLPQTVTGRQDRRPDIGGARIGTQAMLAFEADRRVFGTALDLSSVHTARIDALAGTFTAPLAFEQSLTTTDAERPSVSQHGGGSPFNWIVVAQRRVTTAHAWTIVGRRVRGDGGAAPMATLASVVFGLPIHAIKPSVDGNNTRYMVSYLRTGNENGTTGSVLRARRFLWAPTASAPTLEWRVTLDTASQTLFQSLDDPSVTADINVGNWAIAYRESNVLFTGDAIRVARIGFNGDVVETATAFASTAGLDGDGPAIAFDRTLNRFHITYGSDGALPSVFGRVWTYPDDAINVSYGTSCGGSFGAVTTPLVGTEFFRVRLNGARPFATAALFVGFAPGAFDLGPLGAPGCDLLVDPSAIVTLPMNADANGDALITIIGLLNPIDLYMQWLHVDFAANPFGILLTEGLRSQIR